MSKFKIFVSTVILGILLYPSVWADHLKGKSKQELDRFLKGRIVDESLINYTIKENDIEINVFFNNETYDLIGWQNTDVYQNFNITFLSSIRKNRVISKDIFKLPAQN